MNKDELNLAENIPERSHSVAVSASNATAASSFNNVVVVTTTASGLKPHSSTGGGRLLLTSCTQRNSQDELDQRDLINRHECLKLVRELNREVTAYRSLLLGLGSVGDSEQLRDDLKKSRRKSQLLIKCIKDKLVPWITSNNMEDRRNSEWYRIWTIFVCCMDVLYAEMIKTLSLQQTFCVYSDSCSLINAGWNVHNKMTGDNLSLNVFLEKLGDEREETMILERELCDLQQVIHQLKAAVRRKFPSSDSIDLPDNNNEIVAPNAELGCHVSERSSLDERRRCQRHNRCICWTIITMIVTMLLTTVVILCVIVSS